MSLGFSGCVLAFVAVVVVGGCGGGGGGGGGGLFVCLFVLSYAD